MTAKRVLILTEAKLETGLGHLTRCQALASAFEQQGVTCEMWLNSDVAVQDQTNDPYIRHTNWLIIPDLLEQLSFYESVIVDSYLASEELLKSIAESAKRPVFLDDTVRLEYTNGFVINGAIGSESLPYVSNRSVQYLLGNSFTIFRSEFLQATERKETADIDQILLTFGGNDPRNLLPGVAEMLATHFPQTKKVIVAGPGFSKSKAIDAVSDSSTTILLGVSAPAVRNLMLSSSIAISAGGQTLQELVKMGVPTIAVGIVENQLQIIKGLEDKKAILYAGWWQDVNLLATIKTLMDEMQKIDSRNIISIKASSIYDGLGSSRIVNRILEEV